MYKVTAVQSSKRLAMVEYTMDNNLDSSSAFWRLPQRRWLTQEVASMATHGRFLVIQDTLCNWTKKIMQIKTSKPQPIPAIMKEMTPVEVVLETAMKAL